MPTPEHLARCNEIKAFVAERERVEGVLFDCERRQLAAAFFILRRTLGRPWIDRSLAPCATDPYFTAAAGSNDQRRVCVRLTALAEMLLNLVEVEGFDNRLEKWRTETLEGVVAELEGAHLLFASEIPFVFVPTSGTKGKDYDVHAQIDSIEIACEMKAKTEDACPSARSVYNSLDEARSQVPEDIPAVVFLKISDTWGTLDSIHGLIEEGVAMYGNTSGRICGVAVHAEQWADHGDSIARISTFKWLKTRRARHDLAALESAIKRWPASGEQWMTLEQVVCEPRDLAERAARKGLAMMQFGVERGRLPDEPSSLCFGNRHFFELSRGEQLSVTFECEVDDCPLGAIPQGEWLEFSLAAGPVTKLRAYGGPRKGLVRIELPPQAAEGPVSCVLAELSRIAANWRAGFESRHDWLLTPSEAQTLFTLVGSVCEQLRVEGHVGAGNCIVRTPRFVVRAVSTPGLEFGVRFHKIALKL